VNGDHHPSPVRCRDFRRPSPPSNATRIPHAPFAEQLSSTPRSFNVASTRNEDYCALILAATLRNAESSPLSTPPPSPARTPPPTSPAPAIDVVLPPTRSSDQSCQSPPPTCHPRTGPSGTEGGEWESTGERRTPQHCLCSSPTAVHPHPPVRRRAVFADVLCPFRAGDPGKIAPRNSLPALPPSACSRSQEGAPGTEGPRRNPKTCL
jgi:hypothetical protein